MNHDDQRLAALCALCCIIGAALIMAASALWRLFA